MDNLTHSLVGVALSRAFFKDRLAFATTAAVLAANAPDLDLLWSWPAGGMRYLLYHRGVAHSLWALPFWTLAIALALRWASRRRASPSSPPFSWPLALALGFLGVGSHLALDYTNSYGIRLFAPLSERWLALDWMPIIDPWVWLLLGFFLAAPMVLGLVTREVGGRRHPHRASALFALLLLCVWVGLRASQHAAALALLQPRADEPAAALPTFASPLAWDGITRARGRYLLAGIQTWPPRVAARQTYYIPPLDSAIAAALQAPDARVLLWFARFPLADEILEGNRTEVRFTDLRFADSPRNPFSVSVFVGPGGRILGP